MKLFIPGKPRGWGEPLHHPRPQGHPWRAQSSAEQEHPAPQVRLRVQTRQRLPTCGFHAQWGGQHLRRGARCSLIVPRLLLLYIRGCSTQLGEVGEFRLASVLEVQWPEKRSVYVASIRLCLLPGYSFFDLRPITLLPSALVLSLQALSCLEQGAHGVMVGRSWSSNPWYWSQADSKLFGTKVCRRMMLRTSAFFCGFWLIIAAPPLRLMAQFEL